MERMVGDELGGLDGAYDGGNRMESMKVQEFVSCLVC